jgi:hypothetical protein
VVDHANQEFAKKYFTLQDVGWANPAIPQRNKPLYLDGLAVSYLHTVGLLEQVVASFDEVFIDSSVQDDAIRVLDWERRSDVVLQTIENVRDAVKNADGEGKIVFGPRGSDEEDEELRNISTMHLLADTVGAQALVIDDRSLNKDSFATDGKGKHVPVLTTLDVIEELYGRGVLSAEERRNVRHGLRVAGAGLMAVDTDEICLAAGRSGDFESLEFRAIRESIGIARWTNAPNFPAEIPWFLSVVRAVKNAIMAAWTHEATKNRVPAASDLILGLLPRTADWVGCWKTSLPPNWVEASTRTITAGFALPVEIDDGEIRAEYNKWAESRFFKSMRYLAPTKVQLLVARLAELIVSVADSDDNR